MTKTERDLMLTLSRVLRVVIGGQPQHRHHLSEINMLTEEVEFEADSDKRAARKKGRLPHV
jgi:hypothetical protein